MGGEIFPLLSSLFSFQPLFYSLNDGSSYEAFSSLLDQYHCCRASLGLHTHHTSHIPQVSVISVTLLTLHAYNPNITLPKLSLRPTTGVTAPYYDNLDTSDVYHHGDALPPGTPHRANATLLMLARNSDVNSAVLTVRDLEDRFNSKYNYPWVFLNEQPFSDDFKRCAVLFFPLSAGFTEFFLDECRLLSQVRCPLVKSQRTIGISQAGSMRLRPRKKGRRWSQRMSFTAAVSRVSTLPVRSYGEIDAYI